MMKTFKEYVAYTEAVKQISIETPGINPNWGTKGSVSVYVSGPDEEGSLTISNFEKQVIGKVLGNNQIYRPDKPQSGENLTDGQFHQIKDKFLKASLPGHKHYAGS